MPVRSRTKRWRASAASFVWSFSRSRGFLVWAAVSAVAISSPRSVVVAHIPDSRLATRPQRLRNGPSRGCSHDVEDLHSEHLYGGRARGRAHGRRREACRRLQAGHLQGDPLGEPGHHLGVPQGRRPEQPLRRGLRRLRRPDDQVRREAHLQAQLHHAAKGQADLFGTKGRPSVFSTPLFLPVDATAERNGDYQVHYGQVAKDCPGVGSGGGDDIPTPHDCGVRNGGFQVRLFFHDPSPDADLIPVQRHLPEKNTLKLEGNVYEWLASGGSASTLDFAYQNCPLLPENTYVERAGNIWTSGAHLSEKTLFNRKRRKIVVSGHTIQKLGGGDSTGKTILAWNLRLTRVK